MRILTLSAVLGLAAVASVAAAASQKAHVHGVATLNIAIEDDRNAIVEFLAPSDSIYGFEHEARTDEEKARRDAALRALREEISSLILLEPRLECSFRANKVGIAQDGDHHDEKGHHDGHEHEGEHGHSEDHDHDHGGGHRDVEAEYSLSCRQPLKGSRVNFAFSKRFPALHELNVVLLTESRQEKTTIKRDQGSLKL